MSLQYKSLKMKLSGLSDSMSERDFLMDLRELQQSALKMNQITIFFLSYLINLLVLLGYGYQYILAINFNVPKEQESKENRMFRELYEYQDLQVILLLTSILFLVLGTTLEYIRKAKNLINTIIIIIALLKIIVSY